MSHDPHFLSRLSRVETEEAERALRLYHDGELVRDILRFAHVEGAERVALAIADGPTQPHVIVARNGHFVTCLGAGMSIGDTPRVPWNVVRQGLAETKATQAINTTAATDLTRIFERVWRGGGDVSREDLAGPCAMVPLQRKPWFVGWMSCLPLYLRELEQVQRADKKQRTTDADLHRLWARRWELAHRAVLLMVADPDAHWMRSARLHIDLLHLMFTVDGSLGGLVGTAARFVWAASRMGPDVLETLVEIRSEGENAGMVGMAALALGTLALRHRGLRAQVRKLLSTPIEYTGSPGMLDWRDAHSVEQQVASLLEAPKATGAAFLERTASWALERLRHPHGAAAEEFPADDLVALALSHAGLGKDPAGWLSALVGFLPALAEARALDLYLPRAWMPSDSNDLSRVRELLARAPEVRRHPKRAAPKVGRNSLCACGSGKKAKRCCG